MTRILVQRGSSSSSSNSNRSSQQSAPQAASSQKDEEEVYQDSGGGENPLQQCGSSEGNALNNEESSPENREVAGNELRTEIDKERLHLGDTRDPETLIRDLEGLTEDASGSLQIVTGRSYPPPPPPVPPPRPSAISSPRRTLSGGSNAVRISSSRRPSAWSTVSTRTSQSDSRPSSPKSLAEAEGYNSADEQTSCFGSSYCDVERERLFEHEIKRVKGLEVRRMTSDGNCLFRAVADQVYGDPEAYDMARQMCIDYMERERDHFSQFITEGFLSYCKRKRRDKVYGNNVEIQSFSEMYNRPIHIYSYSIEPINIFHGGYDTDTPPLRLSYHQGNHYNSLVDPRRLTIGAGLGLSSLRGANIDKDQVKAAIKAQQDQQIDNALLAEGRFYSDLEYTEKEIEQMVMEASRIEYLADENFKQQLEPSESSTSATKPSSSGAGLFQNKSNLVGRNDRILPKASLCESMQVLLSMGFTYLQVVEAYSIFGDDVDSMICYLLDMGSGAGSPGNSRQKGKAAE